MGDEKLLSELWTVGMKVPDLVRKVARRVPLRAVQAFAREQRANVHHAVLEKADQFALAWFF